MLSRCSFSFSSFRDHANGVERRAKIMGDEREILLAAAKISRPGRSNNFDAAPIAASMTRLNTWKPRPQEQPVLGGRS